MSRNVGNILNKGASFGSLAYLLGASNPLSIGIGLLGSAFSAAFDEDPETIRQNRINELRTKVQGYRADTLRRGIGELARTESNQIAAGRQAAGRRATALGRSNDAEAFINPVEQNIAGQGTEAIRKFETDTNDYFDRALMGIDLEEASLPIPPSTSESLLSAGGVLAEGIQAKDMLAMYKDRNDLLRKGLSTGTAPGGASLPSPDLGIPKTMDYLYNEGGNLIGSNFERERRLRAAGGYAYHG